MGVVPTVGLDKFPTQGAFLNCRVEVCFNYDLNQTTFGKIVRDDVEDPYVGIIQLDDGRLVLLTECQYSIIS